MATAKLWSSFINKPENYAHKLRFVGVLLGLVQRKIYRKESNTMYNEDFEFENEELEEFPSMRESSRLNARKWQRNWRTKNFRKAGRGKFVVGEHRQLGGMNGDTCHKYFRRTFEIGWCMPPHTINNIRKDYNAEEQLKEIGIYRTYHSALKNKFTDWYEYQFPKHEISKRKFALKNFNSEYLC